MAHSAAAVPLGALEQGCPIRVEHDRRRRQFTVRLNGCHDRAVLLYEYVGKRIVDLQHTEVPDAYRGRGIAKHLAKVGRWGWGGTPTQRKPWPWWLTAACFLAKVQMGAHLANRLQLGDCQGAYVT
uniref:Protein NATD1 n=1 Tax=Rhinolophus ferrumequinum TaxID=59479 RepID=A0A671EI56_RHIFE